MARWKGGGRVASLVVVCVSEGGFMCVSVCGWVWV